MSTTQPLKLIAGLGNIGDKYVSTRHNAGFMFVDFLYDQLKASGVEYANWQTETKWNAMIALPTDREAAPVLIKPTTMMNNSGLAVTKVAGFYKIPVKEIAVAFDDLDIGLGQFKIQFGKGPKVHNGLTSVYQHCGQNFWHIRLGIENRAVRGNKGVPGMEYALQNFTATEAKIFKDIFPEVVAELDL
jgi:PTH1 family peptidyl-tRNA hydrolase